MRLMARGLKKIDGPLDLLLMGRRMDYWSTEEPFIIREFVYGTLKEFEFIPITLLFKFA
jgi:hypothetical protein